MAGCATDKSDSVRYVSETLPVSRATLKAYGTLAFAPVTENPPVMLHASILVTAHRRRDGELLAPVPLDYRSRAHHLKEWVATDAAIFRAELETFRQRCAATVVHWLFDGKE